MSLAQLFEHQAVRDGTEEHVHRAPYSVTEITRIGYVRRFPYTVAVITRIGYVRRFYCSVAKMSLLGLS